MPGSAPCRYSMGNGGGALASLGKRRRPLS